LNRSFRASALLSLLIAAFAIGQAHAAQFKGCKAGATSSLVVNVKARGAKGDGRTNDTKAIRRAINEVAGTGGTVFIPKGGFEKFADPADMIALQSDCKSGRDTRFEQNQNTKKKTRGKKNNKKKKKKRTS